MKNNIVSIADTEEMARTLNKYIRNFLGNNIESYFMTYKRRTLSSSLFNKIDLFILELFGRDEIGYRTEAIPVAEKWAQLNKKVLIVSGAFRASMLETIWYWDFGAEDELHERIITLLDQPAPSPTVFRLLRESFKDFDRYPVSHDHHL